jgi:small nuclear ribonucleoprotein (snRNP)-like protein
MVIAAVAAAHHLSGDRLLRSRTKRRVLVTTHDGAWFSGVLLDCDRRSVVIVNATTEAERGEAVQVDGEVLILTEDIAHIQFP